jgi:uncharacterized protein
MISRREFLKLGTVSLATAGATVAISTSSITTDRVEATRLTLPLKHLPPNFNGYRIGFMSDIHLGPFVSDDLVRRAAALLNQDGVDMLLVGGDHLNIPELLDRPYFWYVRNKAFPEPKERFLARKIYSDLAGLLSEVRAKDGIHAVYGNHDRWMAPISCAEAFGAANINLLVNRSVSISRGAQTLQIVGIDDYWTGTPRIPGPRQRPNGEARILLAHNPDFISETLARTSYEFDLGLAGHTHGGQICLPGIGVLLHNVHDRNLAAGLYQHPKAAVYTTRGIGVVELPLRVNCPPEVCIFTLTRTA